jgi:4-hydroxy-3-methylbut-2-enyl diphosphate reductase
MAVTKRIVLRAETLGYCMGVKRAVEMVYEALESETPDPVQTFGPIIHNKPVLEDLERKGLSVLQEPEEALGTVIIRAHGVKPAVKEKLEKGAVVLDATCPRVLKSQSEVSTYSDQGYTVIIVGDRNHGEVKGLEGFGTEVRVVESEEEAKTVLLGKKNMVIAQTTYERNLYSRICSVIRERDGDAEIVDSICPATERRQQALKNLVGQVDALLIVGGKNSANTKSLYQAAADMHDHVWHIEDQNEIPDEVYSFQRIGLSAGASTPEWVVDNVEEVLITRE